MTGNAGEIKTPRFPLNYPDEVNCEWKICVEEGSRVKLTFSDFEVLGEAQISLREGRTGGSLGVLVVQKFVY